MRELVSVCIPTYNGSKFLKEALESLNAQTYKDFEVIISDDASKDDTLQVIEDFSKQVKFNIVVYKHKPSGIGANWNHCIKKAKGKYIKFLFQDDVLFPTCLEKLVLVLDQNKTVGLVASKRKFLVEGEPDIEIKEWIQKYRDLQEGLGMPPKEIYFLTKKLLKSKQFFESPLNKIGEPSTVIFRKSLIKKVGYFREDLNQILDYEFYYRILKYNQIAIINEELAGFRIHEAQATNVNRNRSINDYEKYNDILYNEFFWFLNWTQKKRLLSIYNKPYILSKKILNAAKRRF